MEYQKYLKYKTKYLQLKAKLTQLGGAIRWVVVDKKNKPITPNESEFIQQQYEKRNINEFTIPPTLTQEKYRYRLNIGMGTGERINFRNEKVEIKQEEYTPPMPSPGGRAMESREFQKYGERPGSPQQEPPSRPVPSVSFIQAKIIIKKYVERFKAGILTVNYDEFAEITAAKNTIEREEKNEEKKTAVKYLYEFAEQFNKLDYSVNDWFNHTLKVLSNY